MKRDFWYWFWLTVVGVYSLLLGVGVMWSMLGSSEVLLLNTPWFEAAATGSGGQLQGGVLRAGQAQKVSPQSKFANEWGLDFTTWQGAWANVPKTYRPADQGGHLTVRSAYWWSFAGIAFGGKIDGNVAGTSKANGDTANISPMSFTMTVPMIALPAWLMLLVLCVIWGYRLWLRPLLIFRTRESNGRCGKCGYLMERAQSNRCPRCGQMMSFKYRRVWEAQG